jgi:hypothetical protein
MRKLLIALLLLVAGVVALGVCLSWFQFSSGSESGKVSVGVTVDTNKIKDDAEKAKDKAKSLSSK